MKGTIKVKDCKKIINYLYNEKIVQILDERMREDYSE